MAQVGDSYECIRDYTVNSFKNPNVLPPTFTYPARTVFEVAYVDNLKARITLADYNGNTFDVDIAVFSAHFAPTPPTLSSIMRGLGILLLPPPGGEEDEPTFVPDNSKTANDVNGLCYFCGDETEPLFGNQRICRRCNR